MTVCVAALCDDGASVIGVSDRMLSTADNQTTRVKVHDLTRTVVALIAGDVALHTELLIELRATIDRCSDTPELLTVKNIADSYGAAYADCKRRRAERQFLSPLGLNSDEFLKRQAEFSEKFSSDLVREIVNYQMPACAALFIGKDAGHGYVRSHIYSFDNGSVTCHNEAGFASIGVGMYQAMSSLMFAGHRTQQGLDATAYMVLAAKKRAEVAPGVGKETDMVVVTKPNESYMIFYESTIQKLEDIYERSEAEHSIINKQAIGECHAYFESLRNPIEPVEVSGKTEPSGTEPSSGESAPVGAIAESGIASEATSV